MRQFLVEGLLLTLLGGGAGLLAGYGGLRVLLALTPESLSRLESAEVDLSVLAFTLGISLLVGLLFSLAPLSELFGRSRGTDARQPRWTTSRPWRRPVGEPRHSSLNLLASLGGRTTATPVRRRTRAALVILQVALSLVLLGSAGLLVRAFVEVLRVDPGFHADRQLTFRMAIPGRYESGEAFNTFAGELQRRHAERRRARDLHGSVRDARCAAHRRPVLHRRRR